MREPQKAAILSNGRRLHGLMGAGLIFLGGMVVLNALLHWPQAAKFPAIMQGISLNAAWSLFCCGLALTLIPIVRSAGGIKLVQGLLALSFALPLIDLAGKFLHFEATYPEYANWQMTAKTAVCMLVLAAFVWLSWRRTPLRSIQLAVTPEQRIIYSSTYTLCLLVIAGSVASFALIQERMEKSLAQNRLTLLEERRDRLESILQDQLQGASFLVNHGNLQNLFRAFQRSDPDHLLEQELHTKLESLLLQGFTGLALRDPEGRQTIQVGNFAANTELAVRLNTSEPTTLLWQKGFIVRTEQVLFDTSGLLGTLVAEAPASQMTQLIHTSKGQGKTGQMEICTRRLDRLVCFPQHLNSHAISIPLLNDAGRPFPMARALAGELGVVQTQDYRNREVVEAFSSLGNLGLGVSMKMDVDELYAPVMDQLPWVALLIVICSGLGVFVILGQIAPLAKQLARAGTQANASNAALRDRLATTESALRQMRIITDNLPAAISYIDRNRCYRFNNQTYEKWFGQTSAQISGRDVAKVTAPDVYEKVGPCIDKALSGERTSVEVEIPTSEGGSRWVRNVYVPHLNESNEIRGVYAMTYDVTSDKQIEQELTQMAQFDSLTALPNRHYLHAKLANALANSRQFGLPLAIMFLDVDRFKEINDCFGHAGGDEVLKEFSRRLRISVRSTDTVARLGGDEFVIILEGLHTPEEPQFIARKILASVRKEFRIDNKPLMVTTSIGIAFCRNADLASSEIIQKADEALYKAKAAGRDAFRLAV
ncbi:MAG: GGDEF domain-containing protein [Pseudomonadota bacterium]